MLRLIAIAALLWPALVQAAPATTTTKTATTRPDSHVWTKRNVELIRQATTRRGGEAFDGDGIGTTLMFSLGFNPLIVHDPYAGEILKHIDAALAKPGGDADARATMQNAAKFLRLPQDERILRQIVREMEDDPDDDQSLDKPVVRPDNLHKLATKLSSALSSAPSGEPYDGLITRTIEKMDAVARQAKRWDHLVLAYVAFAHAALERDQREQANRYIDRMIEIFRESVVPGPESRQH